MKKNQTLVVPKLYPLKNFMKPYETYETLIEITM